MINRSFSHVAQAPIPGDIVEVTEADGCERMLRVLAVVEEHVGFKEYGKGRFWVHLNSWKKRLSEARVGKLFRAGDDDFPF